MNSKGIYEGKNFPGSLPSSNTNDYPPVPGIDPELFVLTSDGLATYTRDLALEQMQRYIETQKENFMGYQVNDNLNYEKTLHQYLDTHVNNIGDPFKSGNFTLNSKFAERAALDYFASLWHAKWPHKDTDIDSYWGYVLSMGSSEGNIYAMWNARDYLAGRYLVIDSDGEDEEGGGARNIKDLCGRHGHRRKHRRYKRFEATAPKGKPHTYTPIAFFSDNTHYSIIKNTRILSIPTFAEEAALHGYKCPLRPGTADYPEGYYMGNLDKKTHWPPYVPSNEDGSVYIPALVRLVNFFTKKGYPVLISFNYGTTFKGALDDVAGAVKKLVPVLQKNNMYERKIVYDPSGKTDIRTGFWLHVDGALGAGYAPFLSKDEEFAKKLPQFDFSIPELHSIIMSGHKWLGAPWPCGVFMSKVKYQLKPVSNPLYIGSPDSTFSGSRNGFSAMLLWDFISRHPARVLTEKVKSALNLADYFMERFTKEVAPAHPEKKLWLGHTPHALTIRFRRPNNEIVYKFSLSNETLHEGDEERDYSHIFIMDHVTKDSLDRLIEALKKKDAFTESENEKLFEFDDTAFIAGFGMGFR